VITTAAAYNFESPPGASISFGDATNAAVLAIVVTDSGGESVTVPLQIDLTNENDAPVLGADAYTGSVAENAASAALTMDTAVAFTDEDTANTHTYSLVGKWRGYRYCMLNTIEVELIAC
jgi:hypothetical protein